MSRPLSRTGAGIVFPASRHTPASTSIFSVSRPSTTRMTTAGVNSQADRVTMTMIFAVQGTSGITRRVSSRWRGSSMVRQPTMPDILQGMEKSRGTKALPLSPRRRMALSMRKAARAM